MVVLISRSAGGTFARWSPTPDLRHYPSEVRRHFFIDVCHTDPAALVLNPSADGHPTHTADRRTEVHIVQYATSPGSAHAGERRRSENNLRRVWSGTVAASVDAGVAESVHGHTHVVRPAPDATAFTAGHSADHPAVLCHCRSCYSTGSLFNNRQKSAVQSVRCYTGSCPARYLSLLSLPHHNTCLLYLLSRVQHFWLCLVECCLSVSRRKNPGTLIVVVVVVVVVERTD